MQLTLSLRNEVPIELEIFEDNIHFQSKITRAQFEELNDDLFRSAIVLIEKALRDANIEKSNINEIVLVGGSTRILKIQKLLQDFCNGKQLNQSINPDEAIAYGAAIQAAVFIRDQSERIKDTLLLEVSNYSLVN